MRERDMFTADHDAYRKVVAEFVRREVEPNMARWEQERLVDRECWLAAAAQGVPGLPVPVVYGARASATSAISPSSARRC